MKLVPSKSTLFTIILYIFAARTITWPLPLRIGSHLPLGTESSATVPLFNLWTLLWNADRLQQAYFGYWNAPIFYPETGTFALSEPQPLTGLIFSPLAWLLNNPVAAYNTVLLLFLTLNGISAAYLLQKLGIAKIPAVLGGLLALALPFVGNELGVLQLTAVFPILFAFGSLYSFAQNPDWSSALGMGWWSAAAFLFSGYYGLFLTLFLPIGLIVLIQRAHLRVKVMLQLSAAFLFAGLILLPVLPEQMKLTAVYSRSDTTIQNNSAEVEEYTHLYRRTWGARWLPWIAEDNGRQRLFPGTILLLLGAVGLIPGVRKQPTRRWTALALLGILLAFILSLGLNFSLNGWQPYRLLIDYYPGFAQLRSPFRLAVLVQIFLVTLAGISLNAFWQRGRVSRILVLGLVMLGLLEVAAWPARLYAVPDTTFRAAWIDWLKSSSAEGAVLMLPMSRRSDAGAFEPIVIGMLQGLEHGRPLGNGYSGFFPTSYRSLKGRMLHFPDNDSIHFLQETGFKYVVIERVWWEKRDNIPLSEWSADLLLVYEDENKIIYEIVNPNG